MICIFVTFYLKSIRKYGKQLLNTATKRGLDAPKTASGKVVHKAAETIGKFIGKSTDKV